MPYVLGKYEKMLFEIHQRIEDIATYISDCEVLGDQVVLVREVSTPLWNIMADMEHLLYEAFPCEKDIEGCEEEDIAYVEVTTYDDSFEWPISSLWWDTLTEDDKEEYIRNKISVNDEVDIGVRVRYGS